MTATAKSLSKQLRAMDWQPIETAPKDGTPILAYGPEPARDPSFVIRETRWEFYGQGSMAHADFKAAKGPSGQWGWHEPIHNWGSSWNPTLWRLLDAPGESSMLSSAASALEDAERERDANHNLAVANGERAKEEYSRAQSAEAKLAEAVKVIERYANPQIYQPSLHGPAFDRRDLSGSASAFLQAMRSQL